MNNAYFSSIINNVHNVIHIYGFNHYRSFLVSFIGIYFSLPFHHRILVVVIIGDYLVKYVIIGDYFVTIFGVYFVIIFGIYSVVIIRFYLVNFLVNIFSAYF